MKNFSELTKENYEWIGFKELKKVGKLPQRQDSLTDQMRDLYTVANHFGLFDAADYIRNTFMKKTK